MCDKDTGQEAKNAIAPVLIGPCPYYYDTVDMDTHASLRYSYVQRVLLIHNTIEQVGLQGGVGLLRFQ